MTIHSAKFGVVNGISTVTNITLSETSTPAVFSASNTHAGRRRREGIYDFSGTFEGEGGTPPVMPGEYFDLVMFTAPATGALGTAGVTKNAVNAIVQEVSINWDWSNGEIINWTVSFAQGEPVGIIEGSASVVDVSTIISPVVCGTKVTLTAIPTTWPNIVSATLTITADNPEFTNSSTLSRIARHPGITDFTCAIVEQSVAENSDLIAAPCGQLSVGGSNLLRLYVDAVLFWDLEFALLESIADLTVNQDTGEIIQATNNFVMDGADATGAAIGHIGRPGEDGTPGPTQFWWPTTTDEAVIPFT